MSQLDTSIDQFAATAAAIESICSSPQPEWYNATKRPRRSTPLQGRTSPIIMQETPRNQRRRVSLHAQAQLLQRIRKQQSPVAMPMTSSPVIVAPKEVEKKNCENVDATFYGMPERVRHIIRAERCISHLYEWQSDFLNDVEVAEGRNAVVCLPTSGGKTLVAELLMLRHVLTQQRDALLILPFVSIVQERVKGLAALSEHFNFIVHEYAANRGVIPPTKHRTKRAVYVSTIEKAQLLVNSLIEHKRLCKLGVVVVDELHMLGDVGRGASLEQTLAKLKWTAGEVQLVGLSATLSNMNQVSAFLKAKVFSYDFRPVKLTEYIKLGRQIHSMERVPNSDQLSFPFVRLIKGVIDQAGDADQLVALVEDAIPASSCLVFCASKRNCESVALLLASKLSETLKEHRTQEKLDLLSQLRQELNGRICPTLKRCIPYGVAYHHSGLTADERRLLQDAYLDGALCIICCTSTLAAGVNLPAKRVILRSPYVGRDFISLQQYKQMSGRAGRAGLDTCGESIAILQKGKQLDQFRKLMCGDFSACNSTLVMNGFKGLRDLLLSCIGLDLVQTAQQVVDFVSQSTLLGVQQTSTDIGEATNTVLSDLIQAGLIKEVIEGGSTASRLKVTKLGIATYKGCLEASDASRVLEDLTACLRCISLVSHLHLLYCIVPSESIEHTDVAWDVFYREFTKLNQDDLKVFEILKVTEPDLMQKSFVVSRKNDARYTRLYLALTLQRLYQQESIWHVAEEFRMPRGQVQNLLQSTISFASAVARFSEHLEPLWALGRILPEFIRELAYCREAELIPLLEIQGVKQARARQLFKAGFKSVGEIARADLGDLVSRIENLSRRQANQMIASAKILVHEKMEQLVEQAQALISNDSQDLLGQTLMG